MQTFGQGWPGVYRLLNTETCGDKTAIQKQRSAAECQHSFHFTQREGGGGALEFSPHSSLSPYLPVPLSHFMFQIPFLTLTQIYTIVILLDDFLEMI
jgi:hypothetical protein